MSQRTRAREALGRLLLAAFSLSLCLAAIEGGARIVVRHQAAMPHTRRSFLRYDPLLGWAKVSGAEVVLDAEESHVRFRTNSQGLRGPERPYAKAPGTARVLLLGDSFAEGGTVDEPLSVRAVLETLLDRDGCSYEVVNGGTSGYSTDQEYLYYLAVGERYEPDVVVLMFFSNDIAGDVSTHKKPWFELVDGGLVLRNSPVPAPPSGRLRYGPDAPPRFRPWRGSYALALLGMRAGSGNPPLHRALERLGLVEPMPDHPPTRDWLQVYGPGTEATEEGWRRTLALIHACRDAVVARGAELVVFYVPAGFEVDERDWRLTRDRWGLDGPGWDPDRVARRLESACQALGLLFVDPRKAFRDVDAGRRAYFRHDPHWTELGHRIAASTLAPVIARLKPCAAKRVTASGSRP